MAEITSKTVKVQVFKAKIQNFSEFYANFDLSTWFLL